jgi:hypothetical protein
MLERLTHRILGLCSGVPFPIVIRASGLLNVPPATVPHARSRRERFSCVAFLYRSVEDRARDRVPPAQRAGAPGVQIGDRNVKAYEGGMDKAADVAW